MIHQSFYALSMQTNIQDRKGSCLSVAGMQLEQAEGNREANLARAMEAIAAHAGHDIYVLPELSSSGYGTRAFERLHELAEPLDGPSYRAFSALARQEACHICYSFPKQVDSRGYVISASVVDPQGRLAANYDKWHVCSTGVCREKDFFLPGERALETFEVRGVRVGLAICYDIRFPEVTRKLTLEQDMALLLHSGGWPRDAGFYTWHTFVQTRAMENAVFIMSTNWAGPDKGETAFCPPFVDGRDLKLEKLGQDPGVLIGRIDMDLLRKIRQDYTYVLDRRPDMYGG